MNCILKIYEVTYLLGHINPEERKIKIESTNGLTNDFIKEEIIRQKPKQKDFIGPILSAILISEKNIGGIENEKEKNNNLKNKIPVFNW